MSKTVTVIVEHYLPSCKQKYLFQNYQQSSNYRSYSSCIPSYLHDRPKSVILHSLDRQTNSLKICKESIKLTDADNGIFEICKNNNGSAHVVKFGTATNEEPSCTCQDWIRYHIPCKHFHDIRIGNGNNYPKTYLEGPYLSTDESTVESSNCSDRLTTQTLDQEDFHRYSTKGLLEYIKLINLFLEATLNFIEQSCKEH